MRSTPLLLCISSLVACGPKAIEHSGYPDGESKPWTKAKKLPLDERLEAKVDGTVSYPKRERARWYVVELPSDGQMTATVTVDPRAPGADVGVEILDGGFNVVNKEEDDEGQPKKSRVAPDVRGGKAYIHVYTLKRPDEADFTLRLRFAPTGTSKPIIVAQLDDIPNTPELPAVPPVDPGGGKRVPRPPKPDGPKPPPPPPKVEGVRAKITEFSMCGDKTCIIMNKGQNDGIEAGHKGHIINVKDSDFTVSKVSSDESRAQVKAPLDVVQKNRDVLLIKPAE